MAVQQLVVDSRVSHHTCTCATLPAVCFSFCPSPSRASTGEAPSDESTVDSISILKNDRAREPEAPRDQRHEAYEHIESSEGSVPKGPGKNFRNAVEWFDISGETLVMNAGLFSLN